MLKEEYKKYYDQIHPSPELIEKTKQRVLQQADKQDLDEEWFEQTETPVRRQEKWLKIMGGLAASIVCVATAVYAVRNLQVKQKPTIPMAKIETTQAATLAPEQIQTEPPIVQDFVSQEENLDKKKKNEKNKVNNNPVISIKKWPKQQVKLDYASNEVVIFHSNFGIVAYSLRDQSILTNIVGNEEPGEVDWSSQTVQVSSDGAKVFWFDATDEKQEAREYEIATDHLTVWEEEQWTEAGADMVESVKGTDADCYREDSAVGSMVRIGEQTYCQLLYMDPEGASQESLAVSVIDVMNREEQIYPVFLKQQVKKISELYNEKGKELFEDGTSWTSKPEPEVTQEPEPESEPEPTVEVLETIVPTVLEPTENPQEKMVIEETPAVEQ